MIVNSGRMVAIFGAIMLGAGLIVLALVGLYTMLSLSQGSTPHGLDGAVKFGLECLVLSAMGLSYYVGTQMFQHRHQG